MIEKTYGTWVKYTDRGLLERTAYTPGEAVKFQFDGWQRTEPLPIVTTAAPAAPAVAPASVAPRVTSRAKATPAEVAPPTEKSANS